MHEGQYKKLRGDRCYYHCQNYEEAVECAWREAKSGEVVILSPASASFDMFKNFEERGKTFKHLVNELSV